MNQQVNYAKIQRIQDDLEALTIGTFGTGFVTDAMLYESGIKATVSQHTSDLADIVYNVKTYGAKCDGVTNDTTPIVNTINAVNTKGGGVVYFPKGSYLISNISLTGINNVTLLAHKDATFTGSSVEFRIDNSQNIAIDGIVFDKVNLSILNGVKHHIIKNCLFLGDGTSNANQGMLQSTTSDYVIIENCGFEGAITNFTYAGIIYSNDNSLTIKNCWFKNVGGTAIYFFGKDCIIESNCIDAVNAFGGNSTANARGIHVYNPTGSVVIRSNVVKNTKENGIFTPNGASTLSCIIDGNTVISALQGNGIEAGQSIYGTLVTNNIVHETLGTTNGWGMGIYLNCYGGKVSGNRVSNAEQHGVYVVTNNITIEGNVIEACGLTGVYANSGESYHLGSLIITNNIFYDDQSTPTQKPIAIVSDNSIITNNIAPTKASSSILTGTGNITTGNINI